MEEQNVRIVKIMEIVHWKHVYILRLKIAKHYISQLILGISFSVLGMNYKIILHIGSKMITCKEYTEIKKKSLKEDIEKLKRKPTLVVIQIGDNASSNSYIKGKKKDCEEVGVNFNLLKYEEYITTDELRKIIVNLNLKDDIDGIIVQLPVPEHINIKEIQKVIDPRKDVDGFHPNSSFKPCTPLGIINYLKDNDYEFCGKSAVVIGRSDIVGKPLAKMLTDLDATVTLCHSKTTTGTLFRAMKNADIVFTCIDKINYYGFEYLEFLYGRDIIDIGLGRNKDGKLCGNINKETVNDLKKYNDMNNIIVSGIGGVGLLTRFELLNNTYKAARYLS